MLGDFDRAWSLVLEFIQNAALSKNGEVSLAALKSLQEIMYHNADKAPSLTDEETTRVKDDEIWTVSMLIWQFLIIIENTIYYFIKIAWNIWLNIGIESTKITTQNNETQEEFYVPSQAFLTALIQIFPAIFQHIHQRYVAHNNLHIF